MQVVTWSSISCFQKCPRAYHFAYERLLRPVSEAPALSFGTAVHRALAGFWSGEQMPAAGDPIADILLRHYSARRHDCHGDVELVLERKIPGMRRVRLQGKLDALVSDGIVEHKTTARTIEIGGDYHQALALDGQVSTYLYLAEQQLCYYDVIRKPLLRQKQSETEAEYHARVDASIDDTHFALWAVTRTDDEITRWIEDTVKPVIRAMRRPARPQHPQRCWDWGRACDYWPICSGQATEHDQRYRRVDTPHVELTEEAG